MDRQEPSTSSGDDPSAEYHKVKLEVFCRLCKQPKVVDTKKRILKSAADYADVIKKLHHFAVTEDDPFIHPPRICHACRCRLERYTTAVHKRKDFSSKFQPAAFNPHTINCEICAFALRRTPRKTPSKTPSTKDVQAKSTGKRKTTAEASTQSESSPPKKARISLHFGTPTKQDATEDSLGVFDTEELQSIPLYYFIEQDLADKLKCNICLGVPQYPTVSWCGHIACKQCITMWLKHTNSCPKCKNVLEKPDLLDLSKLPSSQISVYTLLHLKCKFEDKGCTAILTLENHTEHESTCRYGGFRSAILKGNLKGKSTKYSKTKEPILHANQYYLKNKRLRPIMEAVDEFCSEHYENKVDVLYFMLKTELLQLGSTEKAKMLQKVWEKESTPSSLSPEACLAMRVDTLQSKGQYKRQYLYFKETDQDLLLKPPAMLNKVEEIFMPNAVEFEVTDMNGQVYVKHECKANSVPINVAQDFPLCFPELIIPNCKGVRWNYGAALCKTLEEIDPEIEGGLQALGLPEDANLVIKTFVKDGGDGMGDISVMKEKGDRYLPDKALRFAFCIFECRVIYQGKEQIVYQHCHPNSVRANRPILEAIADENDKACATVCLSPIELERESLKKKTVKIKISEGKSRQHELNFISSMEDEKYDRAFGGLQGSGSSFVCTLCHATRETAQSELGTFKIERTLEEASFLSTYLELNPDNLSQEQLSKVAKGVKTSPLLLSQPRERMLDATHSDINMATFFKKLIVRIVAGVDQWDATKEVKDKIDSAEAKLDVYLKKHIGINPQLMMPGNYARVMFDAQHRKYITGLITDEGHRKNLTAALELFSFMRSVYRAREPECASVKLYKDKAVQLGKLLLSAFPYARWPNYLHKLIEHVQELLEDASGPGSIGAVSGEGSEAGNKLFRHFRKHMATRGNTYNGLKDVLRLHWLYSSPRLQALAEVQKRKYKCTACNMEGHNRLTCPNLFRILSEELPTNSDSEGED